MIDQPELIEYALAGLRNRRLEPGQSAPRTISVASKAICVPFGGQNRAPTPLNLSTGTSAKGPHLASSPNARPGLCDTIGSVRAGMPLD